MTESYLNEPTVSVSLTKTEVRLINWLVGSSKTWEERPMEFQGSLTHVMFKMDTAEKNFPIEAKARFDDEDHEVLKNKDITYDEKRRKMFSDAAKEITSKEAVNENIEFDDIADRYKDKITEVPVRRCQNKDCCYCRNL